MPNVHTLLLAVSTNTPAQQGWVLGLLLLLLLGALLLGLALSPYRYLMGYFGIGSLYWCGVEGLNWLIVHLFAGQVDNSYVIAFGLSLLPLCWLLHWQPDSPHKKAKRNNRTNVRQSSHFTHHWVGSRPVILDKDTSFYQNHVRHTAVFEGECHS
ncbi:MULTISPECIES: hypothetical protein [unclassified Moraxella]|uniref:hypothetical protein n=1 Tax=unclassified Moraxella TaxID=2685852 RepID=UPI003AF5D576